jgi:hypothetical protein
MEELRASVGDKTVTVQVLRVDGKKMPLALFRQIPCADCLTEEQKLDESLKPWGRVAYKIPKEGDEWLLAERDGQLVRCSLDLPSLSEWSVDHHAKGVAEYEEKLKGASPGLADLYRSSLERHQRELPKARELLAANKLRHAALTQLKALPQLFLG